MSALLLWARAAWRTRWPSYLRVAVLVAIVVGAVGASLSAANRSESAFRRLRDATRASDVSVFAESGDATDAMAELSRLPGVAAASAEAELFVRPVGTDFFPDYNLYARAPLTARGGRRVNVPVVTKGRVVDPSRADEMVVSEDLARRLGLEVGSVVTLESMTEAWVDRAFNGGEPGPPDGPKVQVTVVGVSRTPADFGHWDGLLHLSPAFVTRYGDQMRVYPRTELRLSDATRGSGNAGVLGRLPDHSDPSPFRDDGATDDALRTIAVALRLVAATAALAGAAVVALALARMTRRSFEDRRTLAALGWTTRQLVGAAAVVWAPWLLGGVLLGTLGGALTAPAVMVGLARRVDPSPGSVILDGGVCCAVAGVALVAGLLVVALTARRPRPTASVRDPRAGRLVALRRPLPLVLGVRHAVVGETQRERRASRSAVAAMVFAVAGAVCVLVVSASIGRLQRDPELTGQGGGRVVDSGESVQVYDRALPILEVDRRVAKLVGIHIGFGISADRVHGLSVLAYDIRRGELDASLVSGREPRRADEVALGPATLDRLDKDVGDRVELHHGSGSARFEIVGEMLFPEGDFSHDDGVALTARGAGRAFGDVHDTFAIHQLGFEWSGGVDARAADGDLAAVGIQVLTNHQALQPATVTNLGRVAALPRVLAVLLAVLTVAALGYSLTVGLGHRSREDGTLRALGMTRWARMALVACHGLTIVVIALVLGVPLGLGLGARVWRVVAQGAHVVVLSVFPGRWIAAQVLIVLLGSVCVVAGLAWRLLHGRGQGMLQSE